MDDGNRRDDNTNPRNDVSGGRIIDCNDEAIGNVSNYCVDFVSSVTAFSAASDVSNEDSGGGRSTGRVAAPFGKTQCLRQEQS